MCIFRIIPGNSYAHYGLRITALDFFSSYSLVVWGVGHQARGRLKNDSVAHLEVCSFTESPLWAFTSPFLVCVAQPVLTQD